MDKQVWITRVFEADRETVFHAWTDPAVLSQWFAPTGCTVEVHRIDPRIGGEWVTTISVDGQPGCHCLAVFTEFEPPSRLAYTLAFCDGDGRAIPSSEAGRGEYPDETTVTVTFRELGGQTEMTLHQTVNAELAERTGAMQGWHLMFDRLDTELERP